MQPPPLPPFAEEIQLIKQYVNKKDSIVLDIGANIGSFTIFLASIAAEVHAFEPSPYNFKELQENTKHLDNISLYEMALSNELGYNTLHICPTDNGMNRLYNSKWCKGGEKIEGIITITLDYLHQKSNGLDNNKVGFIKIDVEGYEYHVIRGAINTIKRDHPVIMMEWHPPSLEEAGTDPREFYNFMINDLKYNDKPIHCLLNTVINTYEELDNYTRDTPAINILWVPKNK